MIKSPQEIVYELMKKIEKIDEQIKESETAINGLKEEIDAIIEEQNSFNTKRALLQAELNSYVIEKVGGAPGDKPTIIPEI